MDLAGAVSDIGNLPLQGIDYLVNQIRGTDQNYISTDRPFGGSAQLIDAATRLGLSQQPTGSAPETIGRVMAGLINPMAGARAVGRVGEITTEQANRAADALVRQITGNPQATAPQVLQETAMPFMQAVAPRPSGLLETPVKSDLGFYSALEQATIPLQNKGTGSQFLAQIEKTAGVKPEEVKWTGLDDFLKSKPSVTKQEVQDYLAANRVDLQEVALSDNGYKKQFSVNSPPDQDFYDVIDQRGKIVFSGTENDADYFIDRGLTKFSSYTLPGGENYREILLTLPSAGKTTKVVELENGRFGVVDPSGNRVGPFRDGQPVSYSERGLAEQAAVKRNAELGGSSFKSSHFEQPNILAHMRVNDRVVDGKKTLFIEEVQSDWHQAGRKKGYDTPEAKAAEQQKLDNILAERQSLLDEQRRLEELALPYASQGKDAPSDIVDRWSAVSNRINNLQTEQNRLGRTFGQQVPDAPFKTTWHELSLKRAIQEASEKGYDQIAFTTGKTQAERYDLSKQIQEVTVYKTDSGLRVGRVDKDGNSKMFFRNATENNLDEYIGKELAAKALQDLQNGNKVTYTGLDLQVGGEGMKGFYDQILPKSLEKLGKKFDAKVGKTDMDGVEVWKMDITPKMRESVLTKGQPLFAATPAIPALGLLGSEEE
jgi:hypothetical protein